MREQLIRVVVDDNHQDRAHCRYCGKPMIWRVQPNGRGIPLDEHAVPVRVDQHSETYVRYELFDRDARPVDRLTEAEVRS